MTKSSKELRELSKLRCFSRQNEGILTKKVYDQAYDAFEKLTTEGNFEQKNLLQLKRLLDAVYDIGRFAERFG